MRSGERRQARVTGLLSARGCYIDTLNPLPLQCRPPVQLQIEKGDACVEFRGKVVASHPGLGMGLVFEGMTGEQRSMLTTWLRGEELRPLRLAQRFCHNDNQAPKVRTKSLEDTRFLKLLNVLYSKGILSESEADALLRAR